MYYFDNSATTKPSKDNLEIINKVAIDFFGNPSSLHLLGEKSKQLLEQARKQVADLLGYESQEVFFTSSGTESNNWVVQNLLPMLKNIHPDKTEVIISAGEHASMYTQFESLEEMGFDLKIAKLTEKGSIDLDYLKSILSPKTLLLSTVAVNSEVGSIQPFEKIEQLLKDYPQLIWHTDAVQAVTTQMNLIRNPRIDILSLSGHKFHSLRGVGILAKRDRVENAIMLYGGGQEKGLRSGTEPLALIVGTARALRKASDLQEQVNQKLSQYRNQIIKTLEKNNWQVYAKEGASNHIICASFKKIPGEVMVHALEEKDIYVSTTSACSSRRSRQHATLLAMGISQSQAESAIRISMGQTTTQDEVTYLCEKLDEISYSFGL